ncbi:hypothetical protein J437_LFUL019470 [Ladona fulva]|uniref:Protein kinase domain-containing protein n=1 Tax=Ladona fulva TaxID=123851 RepID=A0A8K0P8F1_LADFU|nr:hypothetical protein J437_LFUL019470 [Ladona fulva]
MSECLIKEEHQRWSAKQLLEHPFVKDPIEKGFNPKSDLLKIEKRQNSVSDNEERDIDMPQHLPANPKGSSRIKNEFEIIKLLGKGAFGDVLKAKNKLDGRLYAIKRIQLNPKNKQLNKKITREVKLLSRLNHENVVRYYNSWIECAVLESNVEGTSLTELRSDNEMVRSEV